MFVRKGVVEVEGGREGEKEGGKEGEALWEDALEVGAEDVEEDGGEDGEEGGMVARVVCEPSALAEVSKGLEMRGWRPSLVQFSFLPTTTVEVEVEGEEKGGGEGGAKVGQQLIGLLGALEDDPDVQNVFHNATFV